jgi:tetratricopeptide (TPR) repeat protein
VGLYALIGTVGLVLRAVHLVELHRSPVSSLLLGDAIAYDSWAQEIARGNVWGDQVFYQAPLYPYFLGALYAAFGRNLLVVGWVQAILGASSCMLLAHAGARFFSRPAGMVTGLLLALYPTAIFFDCWIQKSVLDLLFICLLLCLVGEAQWRSRYWHSFACGAVLGLLAITRENALMLLPVLLVWLLAGRNLQEVELQRRLASGGWLLVGLAIVLLPVAWRNRMVGGGFYLTTSQFGPNFYIGNNKDADGRYQPLEWGRGSAKFERADAFALAEGAAGRKLTPGEVSRYWAQRAIADIRQDKGRWLRLMARKGLLVWNSTELGDSDDQYTYGEWSAVLKMLNPVLHYGIICPLAAAGVCLTWARRRTLWVLYVLAMGYATSVALFYVFSRYRFPMTPILLLFAGAGLVEGWKPLKEGNLQKALGCGAPALVVAVLVNWKLVDVEEMRAITHHNLAVSFVRQQGNVEEAIAHYQAALRLKPDLAVAHEELGTLLWNNGRLAEATDEFRAALHYRPDYPKAMSNLGMACSLQGKLGEAFALLSRAVQLDPEAASAHKNLANVLVRMGKPGDSLAHYRQALQQEPNDGGTHYALGLALALQARWEEAIQHYTETLRLVANNAEAQYNLGYALRRLGRLDEAERRLKEALRLKPEFPLAHYNLGCVLAQRGQREEAVAHLQAALRLEPDYEQARKELQRLRAD